MAITLYSVTFVDHEGNTQWSRVFQTIAAARKWRTFCQKFGTDVRIWIGGPGGMEVH